MDNEFSGYDKCVKKAKQNIDRFVFHAPFNELCPAAIDPMIVEVAKKRYAQAYNLMHSYDISKMIVHSGFVPMIYFEEWFVDKAVAFWQEFLVDKPKKLNIYLENVLESSPDMLIEIVAAINDERVKLCLDIGHAALIGPDLSLIQWAERMLPYLGHVHLHNNHGKRDTHNALDDGIIDIAPIIRYISGAAPEVTFTLEIVDAQTSIEWLNANVFI